MCGLKLDKSDLEILRLLQRDGRMTKVKLAEAVNLSPSPCWERLRKLEKAGYITGYHADVDIRLLGSVTEVLVQITLENHRAADFRKFEDSVQAYKNVVDCWAVGGGIDYFLRLIVRDVGAYQDVMDQLLEAEIGIDRYFGYIVTKSVKSAQPPLCP